MAGDTSKLTLPYPLFCAEYVDEKTLLVAGGGGESRSGVGNGLQLIDTSSEPLKVTAKLDLPKTEDAVMSCTILPKQKLVLGGVNQTSSSISAGNNAHFRSFSLGAGSIAESSATQYFRPKAWDDVYQRVTKSSASGKYVAIASSVPLVRGEGTYGGEIVVLSVQKDKTPSPVDRIIDESEIVDVEIFSGTDGDEKSKAVELLAYATPAHVYLRQISPKPATTDQVKSVYTLPGAPAPGSSSRTKPQIRSVKLLAPSVALVLVNLPFRKGVELQVLSIADGQQAQILETYTYHPPSVFRAGISAATALDILSLPVKSISANSASQQVLIGIASADLSVVITILDLSLSVTATGARNVHDAKFWHYQKLSTTHSFPATKVAFSPLPSSGELQVASVSASNTLIVHRLQMADENHLSRPSALKATVQIAFFSLVFIILLAIGLELVFEHRGNFPDLREVWEDVIETVKGGAKLGENEYHRAGKMGKKLGDDMKGVGTGVREGLKKEGVQAVLEGVLGMG